MKGKSLILLFTMALAFFGFSGLCLAVPNYQLDIVNTDGGSLYYDSSTGTITTTARQFDLYALFQDKSKNADLGEAFYISMAVIPSMAVSGDYGSFTVNSSPISVTSMMEYGTPGNPPPPNELPTHGIFPTYFYELGFTVFDGMTAKYDTQVNYGGFPGPSAGDDLYYKRVAIDTSGLSGVNLHFDFYWKDAAGNICEQEKAPFSHDASVVPIPPTILLFGSGLAGLLGLRRRYRKT